MLLANFEISNTGEILSSEIPVLAGDETIRLVRTSYKGEESLLVEVINELGAVADQIMFKGLQVGRMVFELGRG